MSIFVDGVLLHMLRHRCGSTPHNDHMAYDTVNDSWISIYGGLPRHTARGPDRVLGVVNHNGPDDCSQNRKERRRRLVAYTHIPTEDDRGHDGRNRSRVTSPIRYDAVDRVLSVAMPTSMSS